MKVVLSSLLLFFVIVSCNTQGVKKKGNDIESSTATDPKKPVAIVKDTNQIDLDAKYKVVDDMKLSNGMKIKWFKHGKGDVVKDGDMIDIDYKVFLENGEMIDGNSLRNLPSFPYMVGFQMQPGWDFALRELRIGDHVEIFIPYQLSRGDKAVDGLIPEKSNNILKIHVIGLNKPDKELDGGTRVWMMRENPENKETFGLGKRVYFHCYISTPTNPRYYDTQIENNPFNYSFDDPGLVPGLRKALNNAKKADLMLVHVPAPEAYGNQGYLDVVKPNEPLFYRVFVMEVKNK